MNDRRGPAVVRAPAGALSTVDGLSAMLTGYLLQTEAEKGRPVADAAALPERYRAEAEDPDRAFADATVFVARDGDTATGCVVVTAPVDGRVEIKRLWTDPAHRGRGVASALLDAALAHAAREGVRTVRLSVWQWRTGALALYERLGFTVVPPWDERPDLICMERPADLRRTAADAAAPCTGQERS
ncbi:GNAT family N-acetyltransferase [Streptomyces sp. RTGN2]|uniref:GNAT family N-acetyltransferase n=1 Tax=unclassified Streptomyces TaxID=2593676 RepID=UPI0025560F8A|nr:GNAT family N-acetyltransferase [Streptomyces sp. RTGN2]WSU61345.1 GNAT family N-acetyltransferase [Streptomyces sp. NBC_01104]